MAERPILFRGVMVRAILNGGKTQTRRIMKPEPAKEKEFLVANGVCFKSLRGSQRVSHTPYGRPGDTLWVREAWRVGKGYDDVAGSTFTSPAVWYEADSNGNAPNERAGRYRHARFMPRWASRVILEISSVRVERLKDISPEDAVAEGLVEVNKGYRLNGYGLPGWEQHECRFSPVDAYERLWNIINGRGAWDKNPWVWVIEFKRHGAQGKHG